MCQQSLKGRGTFIFLTDSLFRIARRELFWSGENQIRIGDASYEVLGERNSNLIPVKIVGYKFNAI